MKNILYKWLVYFGMFLVAALLVPASVIILMIKLIWQCLDFLLEKTDDRTGNSTKASHSE